MKMLVAQPKALYKIIQKWFLNTENQFTVDVYQVYLLKLFLNLSDWVYTI